MMFREDSIETLLPLPTNIKIVSAKTECPQSLDITPLAATPVVHCRKELNDIESVP